MRDIRAPGTEYQETLDYLYNTLPMFQRVGDAAFKKDLTNTIRLCDALGNPEKQFKSVHVAGTNGKGSSSHYLSSILQSAGYKTGLYTSPHLKSFTERIRINGQEADPEFVVDFVQSNKNLIEEIRPSFFEITVAMAFKYFADNLVDIAVVEVGMGGRLDSTNVLLPEACLITNIGLDHQQWLGDTLPEIATEKAGIIKPYIPVIISEYQEVVEHVFLSSAARQHAPIEFAEKMVQYHQDQGTHTFSYNKKKIAFHDPFLPEYQIRNIPGILMICDILEHRGFIIPEQAIREGILHMISKTGLKGRWQRLQMSPQVYCDVGHNEDGIRFILKQFDRMDYDRLFIIWGSVKDKDITKLLELFPRSAEYIFCEASIPRAMNAESLAIKADAAGLRGRVIKDVNEALEYALNKASNSDLIFIGGSNFVVAELDML